MEKFPYCKLHVLYAFQPKNAKEEDQITEEDIPKSSKRKLNQLNCVFSLNLFLHLRGHQWYMVLTFSYIFFEKWNKY
jgi:hypothetical protein